jgi:hypothetical protein
MIQTAYYLPPGLNVILKVSNTCYLLFLEVDLVHFVPPYLTMRDHDNNQHHLRVPISLPR